MAILSSMIHYGANCLKVCQGRGSRLFYPMIRLVLAPPSFNNFFLTTLICTVRNLRVFVIHAWGQISLLQVLLLRSKWCSIFDFRSLLPLCFTYSHCRSSFDILYVAIFILHLMRPLEGHLGFVPHGNFFFF